MSESNQLSPSAFYEEERFSGIVDLVKLLLMPFVFFALLGFPTFSFLGNFGVILSNYGTAISSFSGLAFFIFCGFFTLVPDRERRMQKVTRGLGRSFYFFLAIFLTYVAINLLYLAYFGKTDSLLSPEFMRLRTFFNFFALNVWALPMGSSIWFIHSLLYAYIFFFLVEKLRLSKTWFYLTVLIFTLAVMLFGGEFAKLVGFPYFGYDFIPGGVVTKAIPFMLIGMFLRRGIDKLAKIPWFVYLGTFFLGIVCAAGELYLLDASDNLVYTGNMIGYAIMAISICLFALTRPWIEAGFFGTHGGNYARRMYAFCQPSSFLLWLLCSMVKPDLLRPIYNRYASLICLVGCFGVAFLIGVIKFKIATRNQP